VCDDGFSNTEARVVCDSLGCGYTGRVIGNSYGAGDGPVWLDNIQCRGPESHITVCRHDWGHHNCSHSDDVSVSCIADSTEAVALVGGGNPRVGRLEVFHANQWGTVCGDGFTDAAARVVCYSLGYGYVGRKVGLDITFYGEGDGLIWFSDVKCNGTEQHIMECSHGDWAAPSCTHRKDVAISCTNNTSTPTESVSTTLVTPVRLVGGSRSKGRLEVLHNGVWGTVCNRSITDTEAGVVCKMLGFESGTKIDNRNYSSDHGPVWLDDVRCTGRERDITKCSYSGWVNRDCNHREDVAVSCLRTEVRLNKGRDPREGRLEVLYDGRWKTVFTRFDYAAALVLCNMLGFGYIGRPTSASFKNCHYLRSYNRAIFLKEVRCTGTEESIIECNPKGWPLEDNVVDLRQCDSYQTVSCLPDDAVALFGGSSREGRLEVYHKGIWGTVCNNGFTDAAARVVCHSLGYEYNGRKTNISIYDIGTGQIWLDNIHCSGTERHIGECSHRGWGIHECRHHEDVAVYCDGGLSKSEMSTSSSAAQIITAFGIVGGLLLIICIVAIVACKFCRTAMPSCLKPRQESMAVPMHQTTSTNRHDDVYEVPVHYENLGTNMQAVNLQPPSAPDAGAVGSEDIYHEPSASARYESLSTYPQAQPAYDTLA